MLRREWRLGLVAIVGAVRARALVRRLVVGMIRLGSRRTRRKKQSTRALYSRAMSLSIRLLGTSASRPTVERNVSSLAVHREGETLMFDCGEGTQRQMMRYGISFALEDIFFTHMHADHLLGVIGLMRTMALQGRDGAAASLGTARRDARAQARRGTRLRATDAFRSRSSRSKPGNAIERDRLRDRRVPRRASRVGVARLRARRRGAEGTIQSGSRARAWEFPKARCGDRSTAA